jgi:low affinity Fe/Cu permease
VFRTISWAYGHPWHFWAKVVGAVVVLIIGWFWGDIQAVMLTYTTLLTVTTDLGTIVIQNTGSADTEKLMQQGSELGRAVPGARDVIQDSPG